MCLKARYGKSSTLNLNYTPEAIADLDAIHSYIADDDRNSADRVIARILQSLTILETHPLVGRKGRVEGTWELSIAGLPYVGVYTIPDDIHVDVIAIIHTSKQYP